MQCRPRLVLPPLAVLVLLLAGCLQQGGGTPVHQPTFDATPQYGMQIAAGQLHGEVRPGTPKTFTLSAYNSGEPGGNTFEYQTGCGDAPWEIGLLGPDGATVAWREEPVTCQAFGTREFHGGETIPFSWTWDGRVASGGGTSDAPRGAYQLRVTFHAMHAGTHPSEATGVVGFQVV